MLARDPEERRLRRGSGQCAGIRENLNGNIEDLVERLKRKRYRAKLVRRHWIPKGNGKMRPLGIPVVEDKLLQLAVRGYWKPSTSRISCGAAMGIGRSGSAWMPWTS